MVSTSILLLTLLIGHSFLPCQADDIVVDRTNWGIIFKQTTCLYNGDDMWQHTYEVDFADIETYLKSSKKVFSTLCASNYTLLCKDFIKSLQAIDEFRIGTFEVLNSTITTIREVIPHKHLDQIQQQRSERALLPFIADISQSLFGTAKQKDLITLQKHIQILTNELNNNQAMNEQDLDEMTSFMGNTNKRFDNLLKGIQTNHGQIEALSTSLSSTVRIKIHQMLSVFNTMLKEMSLSHKLTLQCKDLYNGIQELLHNKLSPNLIPPKLLANTLTNIDSILQQQKYSVITYDPVFYYDTATVAYQRYHSSIYIRINIPITSQRHTFHVFSVLSFPVLLHEKSNHVTQVFPKKPYLGIDTDQETFIELTDREYSECHGQYIKFCTYALPVRHFNSPTCSLAIFLDQSQSIMQLCDFRLIPNALHSFVREVARNKYLISNITVITKTCANEPPVLLKGCSLCIVTTVPCDCSLSADAFHITPRLTSCSNISSNVSIMYPINLALLVHFFPTDILETIAGDTSFSSPVDPKIPKFDIYEHNFSNIIADDKETQLSLKVVAQRAKSQQKVYKTLSHKILSDFHNTKQTFFDKWSSLAAFTSLGLNICLILVTLCLAYKIRKIAIIISVLIRKTNNVQALTPPTFDWFTTSTQIPPNESDQCFERPILGLVILCLSIISIIILIYYLITRCFRSHDDIFIMSADLSVS